MKKKLSLVLVALMIFSAFIPNNKIVYGEAETVPRQIKTRGLVFYQGMASDQIRMVKDFFRAQNIKNVPWGYVYDSRTKNLVIDFQKKMGLKADGIIGKSTIDKMNSYVKEKGLNLGQRIPYTDLKGDMLIINKSSNTLYFMKDGKPYRSYPVATGKNMNLTPNGRHKIVVKYVNPAWGGAGRQDPIPGGAPNNPLGKRWMGISYGGGGQYGIHGNSNKNSIGKFVSLGCIRMLNEDVEGLYPEIKIGTPVWIGEEGHLEEYGVNFEYITRQ